MRLEKRIERQRRVVETLERRLVFERLVLERLERRAPERAEPAPQAKPVLSFADVYRAALARAAR